MSRDRVTSPANPHPDVIKRSYALRWACQDLQQYAKELRRESNLALEESRLLRAQVKLLLSR